MTNYKRATASHDHEHELERERAIDHAACMLIDTIAREGMFIERGRAFLDAANGLDHGEIARAAAIRLRQVIPRSTPAQRERAIWNDLRRLFGWHDVAELDPWGNA